MSNSLLSSAVIAVIIVIVSGYVVSYNADIGTVADTVFTGMLDAAYATHITLGLTAVGSITDDGTNTDSLELNGALRIAIFESGNNIYAAVTSNNDDGVQILNVTNPSNITAAGSITDDGTNTDSLELNGASGIAIFESGNNTYAAVAASADNGVQILDVTNPSNITAAGNITDSTSIKLGGAYGITIFNSNDHTYAAVTAYGEDSVQILNVTNPSNITAAGSITDDGGKNSGDLELYGARGITTFKSGDNIYAAVASPADDGVQILNITNPSSIVAVSKIKEFIGLELGGAYDITTFESGNNIYAAVAAYRDDGVQILNITNPSNVVAVSELENYGNPTEGFYLDSVRGITTFEVADHTYVAVSAGGSNDGVQILDVANPLNVTDAGKITERSLVTNNPIGITTFESGGNVYIAVVSSQEDGVQIIRVDGTEDDTTPPAIDRTVATSLNSVTVTFSENVDADATDGSHWSLDGTDAGSLTVSANTDPARSSNSMTLTLSGELPDTRPDLTLRYTKPNTGGITDGTNQLEGATVTVADGIAPTVTGARAASGTAVTLTISEDVSDASATPGDFSLSGVASSPTVTFSVRLWNRGDTDIIWHHRRL